MSTPKLAPPWALKIVIVGQKITELTVMAILWTEQEVRDVRKFITCQIKQKKDLWFIHLRSDWNCVEHLRQSSNSEINLPALPQKKDALSRRS
jgi:hypothetical protein